jgi:putative phage-type endonuclease
LEDTTVYSQKSKEWYSQRLGKVTASRISDVMAKTKSGYSATRKNYMTQLLLERLTGQKEESYTNAAMQHGIDTESEARSAYELESFNIVTECGFYDSPDGLMSGASPDGLISDTGLIEIKCPNTATHIETLICKEIDRKYILQMQWQMYCTNRQWCDFVSYDNRLPINLRLFIKNIERDEKMIEEILSEVKLFLSELDELEKQVRAL